MKKYIKITSLILIFTISLLIYQGEKQKAEAIVPVVLAVPLITKLLLSAGVTVIVTQQAYDFYEQHKDDEIIKELTGPLFSGGKKLVYVADEQWDRFRAYVQQIFHPGQNKLPILSKSEITFYRGTIDKTYQVYNTLYVGSDIYTFELSGYDQILKKNGVVVNKSTKDEYYMNSYIQPQGIYLYSNNGYVSIARHEIWKGPPETFSVSTIYYVGLEESITNISGEVKDNIDYIGDSVLEDPAYTWVNSSVGSRVVALPDPSVYTNPDGSINQAGLDTYIDQYTGDATKESVINEPITITDPFANPDPITTPAENPVATGDIFDQNTDVNLDPLKVAGEMFTNRFPFSLPWDIYRGFQTIVAPSKKPIIPVEINTKLMKANFTIDLTIFEELLIVTKVIELMLFDIGLIMIARKLMGGDV